MKSPKTYLQVWMYNNVVKNIFLFLAFIVLAWSGVMLAINEYSFTYTSSADVSSSLAESGEVRKKPITVVFVGDIMLDRHIRSTGNKHGYDYVFQYIKPALEINDIAVGNLEGPVTEQPSTSFGSTEGDENNFTFSFAPIALKSLKKSGVNIVSIGNNHILDYGKEGLDETKQFLDEENIEYFGDPTRTDSLVTKSVRGKKLAFISYNEFFSPTKEEVVALIEKVKNNVDFISVYTHWGEEYKDKPNETQIRLAHQFVDAGADIVIGSHPHTIQSKEVYKGKLIYYSLGNFIFDQYWDESVRCGAVITVLISENNPVEIEESFSRLYKDGTTQIRECMSKVPVLDSN